MDGTAGPHIDTDALPTQSDGKIDWDAFWARLGLKAPSLDDGTSAPSSQTETGETRAGSGEEMQFGDGETALEGAGAEEVVESKSDRDSSGAPPEDAKVEDGLVTMGTGETYAHLNGYTEQPVSDEAGAGPGEVAAEAVAGLQLQEVESPSSRSSSRTPASRGRSRPGSVRINASPRSESFSPRSTSSVSSGSSSGSARRKPPRPNVPSPPAWCAG